MEKVPSHDTGREQTTHNCTAGKGIKKGSTSPTFHLLTDVAWLYQIKQGQEETGRIGKEESRKVRQAISPHPSCSKGDPEV